MEVFFIAAVLAIPFSIVWLLSMLLRQSIKASVKTSIIVLLVLPFLVIGIPAINPVMLGIKSVNQRVGGNKVLIDLASQIISMPLQDAVVDPESDWKVKPQLYQSVFDGIDIVNLRLNGKGDCKYVNFIYGGGAGVLAGGSVDKLAEQDLAMYEADGLFLYFIPR